MYQSRSSGFLQRAVIEVPALAASLALAELVYEFHSFTLELLAFLGTWWLARLLTRSVAGGSGEAP